MCRLELILFEICYLKSFQWMEYDVKVDEETVECPREMKRKYSSLKIG